MSQIREALYRYHDSSGLEEPHPGNESGNGLLFTGEEIIALRNAGELNPEEDSFRVMAAMRACEVRDSQGAPIPGLWYRHPFAMRGDIEGPDDTVGVAALSRILRLPLAQEWLDYGVKTAVLVPLSTLVGAALAALCDDRGFKALLALVPSLDPLDASKGRGPKIRMSYVFNNQRPGEWHPSAWFGRFPAVIAAMEYAAGKMPPLWRRLYFAAVVYAAWGRPKDDCDGHTLTWCSITAMDGQDPIAKAAARAWYTALIWKFPNGMKDVFARYFGADHPLAQFCITEDDSGSYR